jgi:hypothetical protein
MAAYTNSNFDNPYDSHIGTGGGTSGTGGSSLTLEHLRTAMGIMSGKAEEQKKKPPEDKEFIPSKNDSVQDKVAKIMASFSTIKNGEIKKRLEEKSEERQFLEKEIEDMIKKKKTLTVTTGSLEKKFKEISKQSKLDVLNEYRKTVTKLKLLDLVETFDVDKKKRIFIITKPIEIVKSTWKKAKIAGRYQIMIDFSKSTIKDGIRAINIDRFHITYDHPNLTSGYFCWGSELSIDLEKEFKEQDLYEIVTDVIDLLRSPNDESGYTQWYLFFKYAKPRPENYSFEKWELETTKEKTEPIETSPSISISSSVSPSDYYMSMTSIAEQFNSDHEIMRTLERLGLEPQAIRHYSERIIQITNNERIAGIEGTREVGGLWLYIRHTGLNDTTVTVSRLFVNDIDMRDHERSQPITASGNWRLVEPHRL